MPSRIALLTPTSTSAPMLKPIRLTGGSMGPYAACRKAALTAFGAGLVLPMAHDQTLRARPKPRVPALWKQRPLAPAH